MTERCEGERKGRHSRIPTQIPTHDRISADWLIVVLLMNASIDKGYTLFMLAESVLLSQ